MIRLALALAVTTSALGWVAPAVAQRSQLAAGAPVQDDARHRTAVVKIEAYAALIERTAFLAKDLVAYQRVVDPVRGPTPERYQEIAPPPSDLASVATVAARAAALTPSLGDVDGAAEAFMDTFRTAEPALTRLIRIFTRKEQKAEGGRRLEAAHGDFAPFIEPLIATRLRLVRAVETARVEVDRRDLQAVEFKEGRSLRWHAKAVTSAARQVVVRLPDEEHPSVDLAGFRRALMDYANAVDAFNDFTAGATKPPVELAVFKPQPTTLLGKLRDVENLLERVAGDAEKLDAVSRLRVMLAAREFAAMLGNARF